MFKPVISGGLKGLILASASALLLSSASLAQEDEGDEDGEADPQGAVGAALHEEGGALDALHEAEGGEAKAVAARAIRDAMLAANENARPGERPETAGRPDTPVRPEARPDFASRPDTPGRPDTPRRPGG